MSQSIRKKIALFATIALIQSVAMAQEQTAASMSGMFAHGKVSGQIREFSISCSVEYSDVTKRDYTREANAIGGYLKFETAFYTTNGFSKMISMLILQARV